MFPVVFDMCDVRALVVYSSERHYGVGTSVPYNPSNMCTKHEHAQRAAAVAVGVDIYALCSVLYWLGNVV